jgi:hypothetical protein
LEAQPTSKPGEEPDMNLFTGETTDTFFGGDVPPAAHDLMRRAANEGPEERATLLWTAQAIAPTALAIYHALYKHHARRLELDLAERAALRGLHEAALQAGLPGDWRAAQPDAAVDFQANGPARFWLFTLKALAFVNLRRGNPEEARALLATIERVEPEARVGDDVIAALLAAAPRGGSAP